MDIKLLLIESTSTRRYVYDPVRSCSGNAARSTPSSSSSSLPKEPDLPRIEQEGKRYPTTTTTKAPEPIPLVFRVSRTERNGRVWCTKCSAMPEGFRSRYELYRHIENYHTAVRKVWVCKDATGSFLSGCKACTTKRKYNSDYNAAAHLRRVHFKPRTTYTGRLCGRGGGSDPPMKVLRQWMEEVRVRR